MNIQLVVLVDLEGLLVLELGGHVLQRFLVAVLLALVLAELVAAVHHEAEVGRDDHVADDLALGLGWGVGTVVLANQHLVASGDADLVVLAVQPAVVAEHGVAFLVGMVCD